VVTLSAHAFGLLVLISGAGAIMVWLAVQSTLVERDEFKRCAACGRFVERAGPCRCARR
jgi:hypothetical protein